LSNHLFQDIDGKVLVFRNQNRPARRFLYFRYILSYMWCSKKGDTKWAADADSGGCIWAAPGKYLRQSTLLVLAEKAAYVTLPEAYYKGMTFDEDPGSIPDVRDEVYTQEMVIRTRDLEEKKMGTEGLEPKPDEEENESETSSGSDDSDADSEEDEETERALFR
jgi:hypothetical protein